MKLILTYNKIKRGITPLPNNVKPLDMPYSLYYKFKPFSVMLMPIKSTTNNQIKPTKTDFALRCAILKKLDIMCLGKTWCALTGEHSRIIILKIRFNNDLFNTIKQ